MTTGLHNIRYLLNRNECWVRGDDSKQYTCRYYTSITSTEKYHRTYKSVLEGADVGVCGLTWWKTRENNRPLDERPLPCHMQLYRSEPGLQR